MRIIPPVDIIRDFSIPDPQLENSENGIPISYFEDHSTQFMLCSFVFNRGFLNDIKTLESDFIFYMLDKAHPLMSALKFQEALEDLGASFSVQSAAEFSEIKISCLSKYFKNVLNLILELLHGFKITNDELHLQQKLTERQLVMQLAKPSTFVNYHARTFLFGKGFPGAAVPIPTQVYEFTPDYLESEWKKIFPNHLFCISLAGHIPDNFSLDWLPKNEIFTPRLSLSKIVHEPFDSEFMELSIPDLKQSSIRILLRLPDFENIQQLAQLKFTSTMLGGFFGSRLMKVIREKEGLTYGIYSSVKQYKGAISFEISTEVDINRIEEALDLISKSIREFATSVPDNDEMDEVKNYMAGRIIAGFDGAFKQSDMWITQKKLGMLKEEEEIFIRTIPSITPRDVYQTASRFLEWEKMLKLVSKPAQ